jgi:hypothetical protein
MGMGKRLYSRGVGVIGVAQYLRSVIGNQTPIHANRREQMLLKTNNDKNPQMVLSVSAIHLGLR